jgi:hypothetical protein
MTTRRTFLQAAGAALAAGALPRANAQAALPPLTVYKNATCGCCGEWEKHMRASGFRVESKSLEDVTPVKQKLGVPQALYSCHTAVLGGYVIEGHVPASDVKRLLRERAPVQGLAVPGMVVGSPGMEGGAPQPYETIAFDARGRTSVFERH